MTDLFKNTFKAAIKSGTLQKGLWCTINDPLVAELCAGLKYDWLLFDTEHSALDPLTVLPLLQAVAPYPTNAIVRPSSLNVAEIKKLLDLGAQNILVPMVNTAEDAKLAVASVEYPPHGIRGVAGLTRATAFGEIEGYAQKARDEIAILIQVETLQAVENLDAIMDTPGLDGIFIGPADLAAAMGFAGNPSHPEVKAAVFDVVGRIVAKGIPAGFLSTDPTFAAEVIEAGGTFVANDVDMAALKRGLLDYQQ